MIELLRAQLLALKAQADAMLATLDACEGTTTAPAQATEQQCPHTETENIGTFGAPQFKCLACGQTVQPATA